MRSGLYTNKITAFVTTGDKRVLTVNFKAMPGQLKNVSASISINAATLQTSQAFISHSQATVVTKNVGARIASAAASENDGTKQTSSMSFAPTLGFSQTNMTSGLTSYRAISVKELTTLVSFDTSQIILTEASNEQDHLKGTQQRRGALGDRPYTVWGHGSFTSVDNTRNRTDDDSRYDGDIWGYNIGMDYRFQPKLVAGVSIGYLETDLTTTYNSGTYDETSWTVSPYAMYHPMNGVTLSAIAGYSMGDVDLTRGTTVTGNTDSDMWFASLNGSHEHTPNPNIPLDLTTKLAVLVSRKTVDAFTENDNTVVAKSTSNTCQLKPGIEASYSFDAHGTTLHPFAKADYVHDNFTNETNGDSGAFNLGGGLRIASGKTGLGGYIEGERLVGRDDYKKYTVSGLLTYNFGVGGDGKSKLGIASPYIKSNFNPDSGQSFGTGLKFNSASDDFSAEFGLTHTMAPGIADTAGQVRAGLKF